MTDVEQTGYMQRNEETTNMNREKFWGALVGALDNEKYAPAATGKIIAIVMTALDYANE